MIILNNIYRMGLVITLVVLCTMLPVTADTATDGGDQGWYVIHCNVQLAKVYLDDKYVGETHGVGQGGTLTVPAYTTGTPAKTLRVQKNGYSTYVNSITVVPEQGGSVDLYATLNQISGTSTTSVGGDVGWYVVHCNIDGATVMFDESNRGEISQGMVYVPVYSTGTPYQKYTVKKDGYTTFTETIAHVPGKGETIDLYATLNPVATTATTQAIIGGDTGWYAVHCNVDGATVTFDNEAKGQITDGLLKVRVYVTGTPYKTFTVYKAGYSPYTGTIDTYPGKGETVDLTATLDAQPELTTIPVSTTKKSPVPVWISGLALVIGIAVASVNSRK